MYLKAWTAKTVFGSGHSTERRERHITEGKPESNKKKRRKKRLNSSKYKSVIFPEVSSICNTRCLPIAFFKLLLGQRMHQTACR